MEKLWEELKKKGLFFGICNMGLLGLFFFRSFRTAYHMTPATLGNQHRGNEMRAHHTGVSPPNGMGSYAFHPDVPSKNVK